MLRKVFITLGVLLVVVTSFLALFVSVFDWNRLKPAITARAAGMTGRQLAINGPLDVDLSWKPLIRAEGIVLDNADWATEKKPFLAIDRLQARIRLLDLLRGRVVLPQLVIEGATLALESDAKGHGNWSPHTASAAEVAADAAIPEGRGDFPMVLDLQASDVEVMYRSEGKPVFDTYVKKASGRSDAEAVELQAEGRHQQRPATLRFHGAPVGQLWDTDEPYPLEATVRFGAPPKAPDEKFSAVIDGVVAPSSEKEQLNVALEIAGSDLAQLFPLFHVVMPPTSPYELRGRLQRTGSRWVFEKFHGRMGESDLGGRIAIDTKPDPPAMEAQLVSRNLALDDLAGLVGGEPEDEKRADMKSVFSAEPINLERLRAMNVRAKLDAGHVKTERLPIDDLSITLELEDGKLHAMPARFEIGQGKIDLDVTVDSSQRPLRLGIEGKMENVPLAKLVGKSFDQDSVGTIDGRAKLASAGDSVKEMAAGLDGEAFAVMSGGKVSHLLVELIGLDVFESLGVLIEGDKPIDVRCGVAKATAKEGLVHVDDLVLDTEDTLITGKGKVNLRDEKANLVLEPHPRDFSPFTLRSPIRISGPLKNVDFFPDTAGLGPGGKVKQVFSTVVSALVGLLPPLDEIKDKDSPCGRLYAEIRESGAAQDAARKGEPVEAVERGSAEAGEEAAAEQRSETRR